MSDISLEYRWWKEHGSEKTAKAITASLQMLDRYRDARKAYLNTCARLYGNLPPVNFFGAPGADTEASMGFGQPNARLTRNIIQSCIDTIEARVASRIHPMVMWLSTDGTYQCRRRAKRLTRFTDAIFREQKTEVLMPACFKDAEIFGSGYVAVGLVHGRIHYERFLEHELHWDEVAARHAPPRELHRVRPIDKDVLLELYPERKSVVNQSDVNRKQEEGSQRTTVCEIIHIRESWRLPDGPKSPGRHVISTEHGCLLDEEWDHDFFPIVKIDYNQRPVGWTGQGLVEILCDTQVALNRHLHALSTSLYLAGTFKIALLEGSRVDPNAINNGFGTVFWYRNPPGGGDGLPRYIVPQAYPAEGYAEIARLEQKAYQLAGVSVTSAAGLKQPGLNAAVAMREMLDIETDRFATISRTYEQAHLLLGRITVELVADHVKRGNPTEYTVNDIGRRYRPVLNFSDIDFKRDLFSIQAFPVSALPKKPEGRLQMVQEWVAAGWIDPRQARRLMSFPDIQSWESLQDASIEWIEYCLDQMVDDGIYTAPDPKEDDLRSALELVTNEIAQAKLGGLELSKLDLLRQYRDEVERLMTENEALAKQQSAQQIQSAQQALPAQPMGVPPPAPVAELLPVGS